MKEYPLNEGELNELAGIGLAATVSFSLATGLIGFAIDVSKDIAFANSVPPTIETFWGTLRGVAVGLALVLVVVGGLLVWRGHSRLQKIKDETYHG